MYNNTAQILITFVGDKIETVIISRYLAKYYYTAKSKQ